MYPGCWTMYPDCWTMYQAVNIPVVANGDVYTRADMADIKALSGCRYACLFPPLSALRVEQQIQGAKRTKSVGVLCSAR